MSGIRQWGRVCQVLVGNAGGSALDLSGLRIRFATSKGDVETPNSAVITINNVAPETLRRIEGEFADVILVAGYLGAAGTIFAGSIRQVRVGREGADSWVEITAADGDRAYNYATVNRTLAAGSRPADHAAVAAEAFASRGVSAGHMPDLGGQPLPRGKVMFGMARDTMRQAAQATNADWSIQDGRVQIVGRASYLPGEAVVLTHETGLTARPEQSDAGIKLKALLNPRIRIGGRVRLDNDSIQRAKTDLKIGAWNKAALIDQDGVYRVIKADFAGDTHGQDWHVDILALALDDTTRIPLDQLGI